jgi:hypothetical protein
VRRGRWTPIIWARKSWVTRKGVSSTRSSTWRSQRALVQPMDAIAQDQLGHRDHDDLRVALKKRNEPATALELGPKLLRSQPHTGH